MYKSLNSLEKIYHSAFCSEMQFLRSRIYASNPSRHCCLLPLLSKLNVPPKFICQQNGSYFFNSSTKSYFGKRCFYPNLSRRFSNSVAKENVKSSKKHTRTELKRLIGLLKPEKWKLMGAIGLLFISSSVTMAVPFSLGKIIDIIYSEDPDKMKGNLKKLSSVLIGLFVLGGLCNFGRVYLISVAGQRITKNLRQKVFTSLLNQELAFFDKTKTGELVNRLSLDTSVVSQALTKNISDGLRSLIMILSGVTMMVSLFSIFDEVLCLSGEDVVTYVPNQLMDFVKRTEF